MAFAEPADFSPTDVWANIRFPAGYQGVNFTFAEVAGLIKQHRDRRGKVVILGAAIPAASLISEPGHPLSFTVQRTAYDYAVAIWRNVVLIEVRQKNTMEARGFAWPTTLGELRRALQSILDDKAGAQTVAQRATVTLSQASTTPPPPRYTQWGGPQVIEHSRNYRYYDW